jgi:hypothetical protein
VQKSVSSVTVFDVELLLLLLLRQTPLADTAEEEVRKHTLKI